MSAKDVLAFAVLWIALVGLFPLCQVAGEEAQPFVHVTFVLVAAGAFYWAYLRCKAGFARSYSVLMAAIAAVMYLTLTARAMTQPLLLRNVLRQLLWVEFSAACLVPCIMMVQQAIMYQDGKLRAIMLLSTIGCVALMLSWLAGELKELLHGVAGLMNVGSSASWLR